MNENRWKIFAFYENNNGKIPKQPLQAIALKSFSHNLQNYPVKPLVYIFINIELQHGCFPDKFSKAS